MKKASKSEESSSASETSTASSSAAEEKVSKKKKVWTVSITSHICVGVGIGMLFPYVDING